MGAGAAGPGHNGPGWDTGRWWSLPRSGKHVPAMGQSPSHGPNLLLGLIRMLLFGCNARAALMAQGSQGRGQCHPALGTPALVRLFHLLKSQHLPTTANSVQKSMENTLEERCRGKGNPQQRNYCKPPRAEKDNPPSPGTLCPQPAPKACSQPRPQPCWTNRAGCCTEGSWRAVSTAPRTQGQQEELASLQHPPASPFSNP